MRRPTRIRAGAVAGLLALAALSACVEVGTNPEEPAAIELPPFAAPSVVLGDTLRDIDGRVVPIAAIVRNVRGEEIADAPVRYLYADNARDSALVVDSVTGIVRAVRAVTGEQGLARIAARVGGTLQVIRTIVVTTRPDSLTRGAAAIGTIATVLPDTGRDQASRNSSEGLSVGVRHSNGPTTASTGVNAWLVRYRLVRPANPTNDTTAAVFIVDEQGRPSAIDTTNSGGTAARRVRVRANLFAQSAPDSVIVEASASYRGQPLAGSPTIFVVQVRRSTGTP